MGEPQRAPRDRIRDELELIRKRSRGILKAQNVVDYARKHRSSALHGQFEWSATKAAQEYWLDQARRIIRVYVEIIVPETRPVRAYVSLYGDRIKDGGGYRTAKSVMSRAASRRLLVLQALAEARRWQGKYRDLYELAKIFDAIDETDN